MKESERTLAKVNLSAHSAERTLSEVNQLIEETRRALSDLALARREIAASQESLRVELLQSASVAQKQQMDALQRIHADLQQSLRGGSSALQQTLSAHGGQLLQGINQLGQSVGHQGQVLKVLVVKVSIISCAVTAGIGALVAWLVLR